MASYTLNMDKTNEEWARDIATSVLHFNTWFMNFAPNTFIEQRKKAGNVVNDVFRITNNLVNLDAELIMPRRKEIIDVLRMATRPPVAVDRLSGLAGVKNDFVSGKITHVKGCDSNKLIDKLTKVLNAIFDFDLLPWLIKKEKPNYTDLLVAKTVICDRYSRAIADPIIRNEQECRQTNIIQMFLEKKGYRHIESVKNMQDMEKGTFTFRHVVIGKDEAGNNVRIPVDVMIMRKDETKTLPLLIECKSAGDYTNTNKRRKEEAKHLDNLINGYGEDVEFILFLGGYFDKAFLDHVKGDGLDWIWEHRVEELEIAGV